MQPEERPILWIEFIDGICADELNYKLEKEERRDDGGLTPELGNRVAETTDLLITLRCLAV